MKLGISVVRERVLFRVEIEGRGGDSVCDEYFENEDDAVLASAIDNQNHTPVQETVLEMSDGSIIKMPQVIHISRPPNAEELAELARTITPAQRILMKRATHG